MADATQTTEANTPATEKGWFAKQAEKVSDFAARQAYNAARFGVRQAMNIYGVHISGLEHFKELEGKPYVITPRHLSMLDAVILAAVLPVQPAIAIDEDQYNKFMSHWWSRPFMKQVNLFPLNPENPYSLKALTKLVKDGKPVLIYPEGRLTDDGNMSLIMEGAGTVAMKNNAPYVPIHMDGLQRLPFVSNTPGVFHRWHPRIDVTIMPPRVIEVDDKLSAQAKREVARRDIEKTMQELQVMAVNKDKSLIDALHEAAGNYGMKRRILDDVNTKGVTYKTVLQKAYGLGGKLAKITKKGENVGVLLPTSVGAAVTMFGLNAFGRVFAPLNVAAKIPELVSNSETAQMKTIVTSHAMVDKMIELEKKGEKKIVDGMSEEEKAKIIADNEKKAPDKIENKLAALAKTCKIVYLEDLRDDVGKFGKLMAGLRAQGLFRPADSPKGEEHALTIFTSGSEGAPKGVAHSSYSLLSNVEQVHAVAPIEPEQKVFNAMPIFHSFGLTGGVLLPMLTGMRSYQFPSPLKGKEIPQLIYHYNAKILFGTDTFLSLYSRSIKEKYKERLLSRLDYIFAGAEKLKESTRKNYMERFGKAIYEGYGRSEQGPVVAINVPGANTNGTLGRLLPGMEERWEDVGFKNGRRLSVRGPNTAMGYILHDNPGVIQPFPDGWDDTGDIIGKDSNEYLTFVDRAKRLAKIGGEYVPLSNIDRVAQAASQNPKSEHFSIEGEGKIILFTSDDKLKSAALTKAAQELQISLLGMPKNPDIHYLKDLPHLGTGKPDGRKLKEMYNELAANAPPDVEEDVDIDAGTDAIPVTPVQKTNATQIQP